MTAAKKIVWIIMTNNEWIMNNDNYTWISTVSLSFFYDINTIKIKFLFLWNLKFPLVSLQISNLILYSQRQRSTSDVRYYLFLVNAIGHRDSLRLHIGDCINDKSLLKNKLTFQVYETLRSNKMCLFSENSVKYFYDILTPARHI